MNKTLLFCGLSALLFSCSENKTGDVKVAEAAKVDLDKARTEIAAANVAFGKGMISGDSAAITALYASDAKAYPPNSPATDGKGMGAMSRYTAGMQLAKFDVKTSDLSAAGDMIIETGTWSIGQTSKELDKGKSMVIWKMEDGKWKMWRDMWNSDNAPAAH